MSLSALALLWMATGSTSAQGQVYFSNRALGFGIDAPVYDSDGTTPVAASQFLAQLYAGPEIDSIAAVGTPVGFRIDGYVSGGAVEVPTVVPGGRAWIEMRVWELGAGASYEIALRHGGKVGVSAPIRIATGGAGMPPSFPASLIGLTSFSVAPGEVPRIVAPPSTVSVVEGRSAVLEARAAGTSPLSWQWFRDGRAVTGATDSTLEFSAVESSDEGTYRVRVTNPLGFAESDAVALRVLIPPRFLTGPLGGSVRAGDGIRLRVEASGSAPIHYQWYEGDSLEALVPVGTDAPEFISGALVLETRFWVRISNVAGESLSSPAEITVARREQSIDFAPLTPARFGGGEIELHATATSGLPVAFRVAEGPGVLNGNRLRTTGAGRLAVRADQEGNEIFLPADSVEQIVNIEPAAADVRVTHVRVGYDGRPKEATISTVPPGLEVIVTYDGGTEAPVLPGRYEISASVRHSDYRGSGVGQLVITGEIRGLVFDDRNGDGRLDSGEPGLDGVHVGLLTADGAAELAAVTTDATGAYRFLDLEAGPYLVREADPEGYDSTTPNERVVGLRQTGVARQLFGDRVAGTVSGLVFDDLNGNGVWDSAEPRLAQVAIKLVSQGGSQEIRTDVAGEFRFEGLEAGWYEIVEVDPEEYTSVSANRRRVELLSGEAVRVTFADARAGRISGIVFADANGNGHHDEDEPGLELVEVRLSGDGDERSTKTSEVGAFGFEDLAPGAYRIDVTLPFDSPPGRVSTQVVRVTSGGGAGVAFAVCSQGAIVGEVFDDLNGNGVRDRGELGLAGVRVEVSGSGYESTRMTDESGEFRFGDLLPGTYQVTEVDLEGYVSVTPNQRRVLLDTNASVRLGFADRPAGTLSGLVFEDINGNQRREYSEAGQSRVEVRVTGDGIDQVLLTSPDGTFELRGLPAGTFRVVASDRPGFVSTTPNQRLVSLIAGGAAFVCFGDQREGRLTGEVFVDVNGSGRRESAEPALSGVAIRLYGADRVWVTKSWGDGSYEFAGVPPGSYTVEIAAPSGFGATGNNRSSINLTPGAAAVVDFGFQRLKTVVGIIFEDTNGNGTVDAGESGLPAVSVILIRLPDQLEVARLQTGTDGSFNFSDLAPGDYWVRMSVPDGFTVVSSEEVMPAARPGAVELALGDGKVVDRAISLTEVGVGQAALGVLPLGSISGVAFDDLDGDGRFTPGERGLGGVEVTLYAAGELEPRGSAVTLFDGSYQFDQLTSGRYEVRQEPLPGYHAESPLITVTVPVEGAAVVSFPNRAHGAISGIVFQDRDQDGIYGKGEEGIGGVTVWLLDDTGLPLRETQTAMGGAYLFAPVFAGNYRVVVSAIDGLSLNTAAEVSVESGMSNSAVVHFGLFLDLGEGPSIETDPFSQRVWEEADVKFQVGVKTTEPVLYQWWKDGVPLEGATNVSLAIAGVSVADQGFYALVVANRAASVTSRAANLEVFPESKTHRIETIVESGRLGLQFIRPTNIALERFHLEGSSDLLSWIPVETSIDVVRPLDNLWELARFRGVGTDGESPQRFFRLWVDGTEGMGLLGHGD